MIDLKTLLNPWILLGAIVWTGLVASAGYMTGAERATEVADAKAARLHAAALQQQIDADAEVLRIERDLRARDRAAYDNFYKESSRAKAETDRLIAGLRSDVIRLRVPVRYTCPAAKEDAGRSPAPGTGEQGYAELDPGTAEDLVTVTRRGDDAIRKHSEVVDRYERLRLACTGESEPQP